LEGEVAQLIQMEERLHDRVIGQDEAVSAVANAVRRSRSGLADPNRPVGSFIFLGPTGVGKTELARALAEFLFDDEQALIRLDMSEYQEKHTVARKLGAIVDIQLSRLRKRLEERKITLAVTDDAKHLLIERGWDPVYGARPLKRAIQRLVQDPLAVLLLEGRFADGDTVKVDAQDGK